MKAKILERTLNDDSVSTLRCEIFADDGSSLGVVEVADGTPATVRAELRAESARLQVLTVGAEISL